MTPAPPPFPSTLEESLVANAGFLRGLAARLVADPGTADDVVQETYLAAVRRAPEPREGLRGWLATVARNAARMAGRTSARRAHRERAAARPEGCPSPEDVLGREEARRRVVDAVLRLEVPCRDVILLRYYEGLPPREAAARLGIPVETVRTRTRRAIERLRADLDRRHGDRRVWAIALAPLANAEPPPHALLLGAAAMSTKGKTLAAIVVLALAAGGAWLLLGDRTLEPAGRGRRGPGAGGRDAQGPASLLAARGAPPDAEPERGAAPPMRPASRSTRPLGVLRGVVASGRTHVPVAGATVVARPTGGVVPDGFSADGPPDDRRTATTDAEGRFVLEGVPVGAWTVAVTHAEEGEASGVGASGPDAAWLLLYPMPRVAGADDVVVRVVDAGQRPVAGARVELASDMGGPARVETADAEGLARFADVASVGDMAMGWATATGPEGIGRTAWRHARRSRAPDALPVVVTLAAAGAIEGRLVVPPGESPKGIAVEAWSMTGGGGIWTTGLATTATADAEGRWRVDGLPAGVMSLVVRPVRGLRLAVARQEGANVAEGMTEYDMGRVTVEAGRTAHADLTLVRGGKLAGRVVALASGSPIAGVRVEAHLPQGPWDYSERYRREGVHFWRLDGPWPDARRHPLTFRVLATDADGRYVLDGLLPGPWRVTVAPRGALGFDRREDVPVKDGETTTLDHALVAGGTLELVAVPFSSLGVRRKGDGAMLTTFLTPSGATGAATLPGLPAGAYELVHAHSDPAQRPIPVADFEIRPGRDDLRRRDRPREPPRRGAAPRSRRARRGSPPPRGGLPRHAAPHGCGRPLRLAPHALAGLDGHAGLGDARPSRRADARRPHPALRAGDGSRPAHGSRRGPRAGRGGPARPGHAGHVVVRHGPGERALARRGRCGRAGGAGRRGDVRPRPAGQLPARGAARGHRRRAPSHDHRGGPPRRDHPRRAADGQRAHPRHGCGGPPPPRRPGQRVVAPGRGGPRARVEGPLASRGEPHEERHAHWRRRHDRRPRPRRRPRAGRRVGDGRGRLDGEGERPGRGRRRARPRGRGGADAPAGRGALTRGTGEGARGRGRAFRIGRGAARLWPVQTRGGSCPEGPLAPGARAILPPVVRRRRGS